MKKRVLSLLLAAVLVLALLPFSPGAAAAETMKSSDELVELIKKYEGFVKYPVWDNSQYSVGYGTRCPDDKLKEYLENGISKEEAEALLRKYISMFEGELNRFMTKYSFTLTQQQFDAVICLTFNCGGGWMYQEGILADAIKNGATGNELIYAFSLWSKSASGGLVGRRLAEANLYLNGVYSNRKPANYSYIYFDANGGTINYNVQGFDTALENAPILARILSAPTTIVDGVEVPCEFAGWYTEKVGGTKVENLDGTIREASTLYAHWNAPDGGAIDPIAPEITPTYGIVVTVTGEDVNVRTGPSISNPQMYIIAKGAKITITHTSKDSSGYLWGKFSYNSKVGWIRLDFTDYEAVISAQPSSEMGTVVVESTLNIRSGPGTTYAIVGSYQNGERVSILDRRTVGTITWGRTDRGWVSMEFIKLDSVDNPEPKPTEPKPTEPKPTEPKPTEAKPTEPKPTEPKPTEPTQPYETWVGVVQVSSWLNIRSGPGSNYTSTGILRSGDKVTVLEEKTIDGDRWGRIDKGWVFLAYVIPENEIETPTTPPETEPKPTEPKPTEPKPTEPKPTEPKPTEPKPTEPKPTDTLDGNWSGTVSSAGTLVVRQEPGRLGTSIGKLNPGDRLTVTQKVARDGKIWGKIESGWVCLDYVNLNGTAGNPVESGKTSTVGVVLDDPLVMTVSGCSLRVRSSADYSGRIVGFLSYDNQVTILETKIVGSTKWGRTNLGWVDMRYLK